MTLNMADVVRAISEERVAWGCEATSLARNGVMHRTISQDRRDAVNMALLNVLSRLADMEES